VKKEAAQELEEALWDKSRLADKQTIQTIDLRFGWLDILKLQACLFRLVNQTSKRFGWIWLFG